MALIRINTQAIVVMAKFQAKSAEIANETVTNMRELVSRLDAAWDGGASIQARNTLMSLAERGRDIAEGCNACGQKLSSIVSAFESVDEGGNSIVPFVIDRAAFAVIGSSVVKCINPFILGVKENLRVIPEEVQRVGKQCKELSGVYAKMYADLRNETNELMNEWEGRSAQKYAEEIEELIDAIVKMSTAVDDFGDRLLKAAARYEELDNTL